jgi:hypothetical protein
MSVFKTTFSRALQVVKSDYANIPYPTVIGSGAATSSDTNLLIDSAATFITNNVQTGDIVYNTTNLSAATVVEVIDENTLLLNSDIFQSGWNYTVYQASSQTGLGNQGCYLYVGNVSNEGGVLTVTTIGGDIVVFDGIQDGTILPVQVIKLNNADNISTDNGIIALW